MRLLKVLLLLMLLAITGLMVIVATPAGLRGAVWMGERMLPGELVVRDLSGRLLDRLEIGRLDYRQGELDIAVEDFAFAWRPLALARGILDIELIDIGSARFVVPEADGDEGTDGAWTLPVNVRIGQLNIGDLDYRAPSATGNRLHSIYASAYTLDDIVHIESLSARGDTFTASLGGKLQIHDPWQHEFTGDFELALPDQPAVAGQARAGGDIRQASIDISLAQPSPAKLRIDISNPLQAPDWNASLTSKAFDLAPWLDSATTATIDLQTDGKDQNIHADLDLNLSGDIEQQITAQTDAVLIDNQSIRFQQLALASQAQSLSLALTGTLDWTDELMLDLEGDWSIETPQAMSGDLAMTGGLTDYDLEFSAVTEHPLQSRWQLSASGSDEAIDIRRLSGRLAEGTIEGGGHFAWQPAPTLSFTGRWRNLAWPLDKNTLRSPQGQFSIQGVPDDYALESSGELRYPAVPALDWQLRGRGDQSRLVLESLIMDTLKGQIQADGELAWNETPRVNLDLVLDAINPGAQWPDWPGRLNGRTQLSARQRGADWQAQLQNLQLNGRLRGYPVSASGGIQAMPDRYDFKAIRITVAESVLQADGRLADNSDLGWQLKSPDLSHLLPEAAGRISAEGRVRGQWTLPELQAEITAQDIDTPWLRLAHLEGQADIQAADDRFDIDLNVSDLAGAGQTIEQIVIQSQGRLSQHTLQLNIQENDQRSLRLAGRGQWADSTWSLSFDEGIYHDPAVGNWQLEPALALVLQQDAVEIPEHCWQQPPARLCLGGDWQGAGPWAARLKLEDYMLTETTPLPEGWSSTRGSVTLSLDAEGRNDQPESITGELRLTDVTLEPEPDTELVIPELVTRLDGDAGGLNLTLDGQLGQPATGSLSGRLKTDRLTFDRETLMQSGLDGDIRARIDDLQPLLALYPRFDADQARLDMDYTVTGQVGNPALNGDLTLTAAQVGVPELGLELEEFELQVAGDPGSGLTLTGHATSGPGKLDLDGRIALTEGTLRMPGLNIRGERFELLNLPEAWILASPDLQLQYADELLTLEGRVTIPEALLQPLGATSAIPVSEDERIVDDEAQAEEQPVGFDIDAAINLILGDNVRITGRGFEGRLTGSLDIRQQPGRQASAQGEVQIVDAKYSAYGQGLKVDSGRIIFTGQPIDDPAIEARATRTVDDVTAGIRATGTAQQPVTELFSTPDMPEADILSYLMVGRPLSGASSGEGDMLLQAATSMGIKNTESLRQSIAGSLGLDTLAIDTGSGTDEQDGTQLVIGKYLAPNLYISYGAGLVEAAANTVRLRYDITDYLSLEAEQGKGTGVDLLYQIER